MAAIAIMAYPVLRGYGEFVELTAVQRAVEERVPPAGSGRAVPAYRPAVAARQRNGAAKRKLIAPPDSFQAPPTPLPKVYKKLPRSVPSNTPVSLHQAAQSQRAAVQAVPSNTPVSLHQVIVRESAKHNLDPAFVAAVMQVESNFDVCAVSRAGARGLMQLMPATARELGVRDIFDPEQNIEAGVRYLAEGTRLTQGNLDRTCAFYNAGPKSLKSTRYRWPRETRRYVEKVRRKYSRFPGDRWKRFTPSFVYNRQCA